MKSKTGLNSPLVKIFLSVAAMLLATGLDAQQLTAPPQVGDTHIKAVLAGFDTLEVAAVSGRILYMPKSVQEFYNLNHHAPVWSAPGAGPHLFYWLVGALREVEDDGLMPQDYHLVAIEKAIDDWNSNPNPTSRAHLDILLTDAYLLVASHLKNGKTSPVELCAFWNFDRGDGGGNMAAYLQGSLDAGRIFASLSDLRPAHSGYDRLRQKLRFYRMWLVSQTWDPIEVDEPLRPGETHPKADAVRQRLMMLRDLRPYAYNDTSLVDSTFTAALQRFQKRHGLGADGVAGKNTMAALNITPAERIQTAMVNLERLRWLPRPLDEEHVVVNIANFQLDYVLRGDTLVSCRAIVGQPFRKTPVFTERMNHLVFSPSWTVPPGILRKDVIPAVRKNANYLAEKGMVILDRNGKEVAPALVDWSAASFPYTIRQRPGPQNALGQVKFMFPNSYSVYIHDTPTRNLFSQDERAFSSGCIRISKPYELAAALLRDQAQWDEKRIRQAMQSGKEQTVQIRPPVRVYINYFTAWVEGDVLHFRKDIYQRDGDILKGLQESFQPAWLTSAGNRKEVR